VLEKFGVLYHNQIKYDGQDNEMSIYEKDNKNNQ
jgi:hypothetical protein